jgi:hypothetical protein
MDGLISVERFQTITDPDKMLSLSIWRDEEAVKNWRNHSGHRGVQAAGRNGVFRDYRLRVAGVIRDYGPNAATRRRPIAGSNTRVVARPRKRSTKCHPGLVPKIQPFGTIRSQLIMDGRDKPNHDSRGSTRPVQKDVGAGWPAQAGWNQRPATTTPSDAILRSPVRCSPTTST